MDNASSRRYGVVKWFGGFNRQTQRENHFGFVQGVDGLDYYLHRNDWQASTPPVADEVVTFIFQTSRHKASCQQTTRLVDAALSALELHAALDKLPIDATNPDTESVRTTVQHAFEKLLLPALRQTSADDLRLLVQRSRENPQHSIFRLIDDGLQPTSTFTFLLEATGTPITDDIAWYHVPESLMVSDQASIAAQLWAMPAIEVRRKCDPVLPRLPLPLIALALAKDAYAKLSEIEPHAQRVQDYLFQVITSVAPVPDYLQVAGIRSLPPAAEPTSLAISAAAIINSGSEGVGDTSAASYFANYTERLPAILVDMLAPFLFRRSLYARDTEFIAIYQRCTLAQDAEYFILYHLFSLFAAGNSREVVFTVFLQRLWEAFMRKEIDLDDSTSALERLFPSCTTMEPLSCEAVFWKQRELFLCRSKLCKYPRILPSRNTTPECFSIYDWFHHWGIDYLEADRPQNRDFPIKLAGYINRLREIFPRLHCRTCTQLILPDMRYSRTQYQEMQGGVKQTTEMAAAYRLTVFKCNNEACAEYGHGHYISHCRGFGCYAVIDSRDAKSKCSHGRYICADCGSCCEHHEAAKPAGLCADCGGDLEVRWQDQAYRTGFGGEKRQKIACCTHPGCAFVIDAQTLPARFKKIRKRSISRTSLLSIALHEPSRIATTMYNDRRCPGMSGWQRWGKCRRNQIMRPAVCSPVVAGRSETAAGP